MTKTIDRKTLKGPDAFQKKTLRAFDWMNQRKPLILLVIAPIVIVGLGWLGWQHYTTQQTENRLKKLTKIDLIFNEEQEKIQKDHSELEKQINAIQELVKKEEDSAKEAKKPVDQKKIQAFNKTKEELEAKAKAKAIKPNNEASQKEYENFFVEFPRYPEGWAAGMKATNIYVEMRDYKKACDLLKSILKNSENSQFYQVKARFYYIGLLEQLGDYQIAISESDTLLKQADEKLAPRVLLTKGRIQLLGGDKDGAAKTLAVILEKYADSPEADTAQSIKTLF